MVGTFFNFSIVAGSPGAIEYGYSIGIHHGDGYSYQTRTGFDTYNSFAKS